MKVFDLLSGSGSVQSIHKSNILSVAVISESLVATGDSSGLLVLWDLTTASRKWIVTLPGSIHSLTSIDGAFLFVGFDDYDSVILDIENGSVIQRYLGFEGTIMGVAVLQPGLSTFD